MHRGREHERIGRLHRVDGIVHQSAAHAAPGRTAAAAGHAAAHLLGTDGQDLHLGTGRIAQIAAPRKARAAGCKPASGKKRTRIMVARKCTFRTLMFVFSPLAREIRPG